MWDMAEDVAVAAVVAVSCSSSSYFSSFYSSPLDAVFGEMQKNNA